MKKTDCILVTGASGLIGSALCSQLSSTGHGNILAPSHSELDLSDQGWTEGFFLRHKIDYVFHCAGHVGGILANSTEQYEFLYKNLMIAANVIHSCKRSAVKKILFMGSSCIYPRMAGADGAIVEGQILSGPLEPTNEGYAIAKIVGMKLCEFYRKQTNRNAVTVMLTNSYGPRDNFDLNRAHIIPALMHRFHQAKLRDSKSVEIWGNGTPVREFLHSEDAAKALMVVMEKYDGIDPINIGCGQGITVSALAEEMRAVVGLKSDLVHDLSKPTGTPRKVLDTNKINELGWYPQITLKDGLRSTYRWAVDHKAI